MWRSSELCSEGKETSPTLTCLTPTKEGMGEEVPLRRGRALIVPSQIFTRKEPTLGKTKGSAKEAHAKWGGFHPSPLAISSQSGSRVTTR